MTIRYSLNLKLYQQEKIFGPGAVRLLWGIQEGKSLRAVAAGMNMAYSKAWRLIKNAEKHLGFPLLDTRIGGADGGGASLTREARTLLARYLQFEYEVYCRADEAWQKYFPEFPLDAGQEKTKRSLSLPRGLEPEEAARLLPEEAWPKGEEPAAAGRKGR